MKTLTLIVPAVDGWPATRPEGGTPWPTLARFAGRGNVSIVASTPMLRPWQRACVASVGLASAEAGFASAAVSWQSAAGAAVSATDAVGIWMHAEPAHLAAGLDTLRFLR